MRPRKEFTTHLNEPQDREFGDSSIYILEDEMNMTLNRRQTLWEMCNESLEALEIDDAEWVCEQWYAEFEWPHLTNA